MTLVLSITNVDQLDNGVPTRLTLDRHGAVIGRSPHVDWSLPDPRHYISSTHCEIDYRNGAYTLIDKSTNGTFVNGEQDRLRGPHQIADGDVILIGHYQIGAMLEGAAAGAGAPVAAPPVWGGWGGGGSEPAPPSADNWGTPAPESAISGRGAMSQHWAPPRAETPTSPSSVWAQTPPPAATSASAWSSPAPDAAPAPSASDVWGRLEAGNVVDWARGFGTPATPPPSETLAPIAPPHPIERDPFGLAAPSPSSGWAQSQPPTSSASAAWGAAGVQPEPSPPAPPVATALPSVAAPPTATGAAGGEWSAFLSAAGLAPSDLKLGPVDAMAAAGVALRRLIGGVVVMLEARTRAKAQLGAQGTALEFDGNNPLKFARAPERALAQLINPAERGFMPADQAIEDAFRDLQAHQMATLAAMQGALAATLARFSPEAISNRAESGGVLAKILPATRDAALWHAYKREFEGVARGSDEAFMDVFAKEFRLAYEKASAEMKRKG